METHVVILVISQMTMLGLMASFSFLFFYREEMETLLVSITTSWINDGKVQNISKIRQPGNLYAVETSHQLNITAHEYKVGSFDYLPTSLVWFFR